MQLNKRMARADHRSSPTSRGCTCLRLRKASRRVSQIYDQHLEPFGLTVTQYGVLGHLATFNGLNIGELAEKLVMDPTTLTRNLRPLQRQGLLAVKTDRRDRRARTLELTARGIRKRKAGMGPCPAPCRTAVRGARDTGAQCRARPCPREAGHLMDAHSNICKCS
jgi:DNA-binding transcriptional ArsR family regulator